MSRSSKKGPFIDARLLARIEELNTSRTKRMIKTWSRASTVFPEMENEMRKLLATQEQT